MGGSGGFLGPSNAESIRARLRESERRDLNDTYEADVAEYLGEQLATYNSRDVDGTKEILDRIRAELSDEVEASIDLVFGGSVAKHTYVDGLSDVDALVLLKAELGQEESPQALRTAFADKLRSVFGRDYVKMGRLAVTLTIDDKIIQLLPAFRHKGGFRISSSDGHSWATISPKRFTERLTGRNTEMGGKLVPTIKLAKAIIAALPEKRQLTGFHTEMLAVRVFKDYDGPKTHRAMLRHFFESVPDHVKTPMRDPTRQSQFADEYLGPRGSVERRVVADALGRIARKIKNADGAADVNRWRNLLTD
jgi:hypothetical protein